MESGSPCYSALPECLQSVLALKMLMQGPQCQGSSPQKLQLLRLQPSSAPSKVKASHSCLRNSCWSRTTTLQQIGTFCAGCRCILGWVPAWTCMAVMLSSGLQSDSRDTQTDACPPLPLACNGGDGSVLRLLVDVSHELVQLIFAEVTLLPLADNGGGDDAGSPLRTWELYNKTQPNQCIPQHYKWVVSERLASDQPNPRCSAFKGAQGTTTTCRGWTPIPAVVM